MMREFIERLRYRFYLWQREQREDLVGAGQTSPPKDARDTSHYDDPRNVALVTGSTFRFALSVATVFFGGIAMLAIFIYGLMAAVWPSARHVGDIIMLVLGSIWSLGIGFAVLDMCIARRKYRNRARKKI